MISATEIRRGMILEIDHQLYEVMDFEHITPGNRRAMIVTKLRNLRDGALKEIRFYSTEKVQQAVIESVPMEYLYQDGYEFVFMNTQTSEELRLSAELIKNAIPYLIPNIEVTVNFYEGKPIGIQLPITVDLKVTKTEPILKGATITNVYKPATLETGLVIQVPPFIQEGDTIRVDTRDGKYVERVK